MPKLPVRLAITAASSAGFAMCIWYPAASAATGLQLERTELYAGIKSDFWLSPAYDMNVLRVDVFWYINNEGNPAAKDGMYSLFWELMRSNGIPFRLHWGKFLPEYDYPSWAAYLRSQYPRWDDFMKKRKEMDPNQIVVTDYWRKRLEIEPK